MCFSPFVHACACVCVCGPVSRAGGGVYVCGCVRVHVHGCVHVVVGTCAYACTRICLCTVWACVCVCAHAWWPESGWVTGTGLCGVGVRSFLGPRGGWRPVMWPGCHAHLGPCRPCRRPYPGLTCAPNSPPHVQGGSSLPLRSGSVVLSSGKLLDLFALLGGSVPAVDTRGSGCCRLGGGRCGVGREGPLRGGPALGRPKGPSSSGAAGRLGAAAPVCSVKVVGVRRPGLTTLALLCPGEATASLSLLTGWAVAMSREQLTPQTGPLLTQSLLQVSCGALCGA